MLSQDDEIRALQLDLQKEREGDNLSAGSVSKEQEAAFINGQFGILTPLK